MICKSAALLLRLTSEIFWISDLHSEEVRRTVGKLHSYGVHHHDLKAANFVRGCQDNVLRLIDFEMAETSDTCAPVCPLDQEDIE